MQFVIRIDLEGIERLLGKETIIFFSILFLVQRRIVGDSIRD